MVYAVNRFNSIFDDMNRVFYWEMVNNNGKIHERSNLTPLDKIRIQEYEVERKKNIVESLEKKLETAKKDLKESIDYTNQIKKEATKYLDNLKKEIK